MTDARSDSFWWISGALKPGVPRGTRNPRTPSSVRAHTTATSATEPFVIHIFVPLRIQSSPSRRARVRIAPGSEPEVGLGQAEAADRLARAIRGSHSCFCSSEPQRRIANIASEPCTETRLRTPGRPPRAPCRRGRTRSRSRPRSRSPRGACRAARACRARARSSRGIALLEPVADVGQDALARRTRARCRGSAAPRRRAARRSRGSRAGRGQRASSR